MTDHPWAHGDSCQYFPVELRHKIKTAECQPVPTSLLYSPTFKVTNKPGRAGYVEIDSVVFVCNMYHTVTIIKT